MKNKTLPKGFIMFADERGISGKSNRRLEIHSGISNVDIYTRKLLENIGIRLFTNCTTIVSNTFYDSLEKILSESINMWKEVEYPFTEEVYVRTSTFENRYEFSLPSSFFNLYNLRETSDLIRNFIYENHSPEQILLHPRIAEQNLLKNLSVVRFKRTFEGVSGEIGDKGILDVRGLENAHCTYDFRLYDGIIQIDSKKKKQIEGFSYLDINSLEKIVIAGGILLPFIEKFMISEEKKPKGIVVEFQILRHDDKLYFLFTEIESI